MKVSKVEAHAHLKFKKGLFFKIQPPFQLMYLKYDK